MFLPGAGLENSSQSYSVWSGVDFPAASVGCAFTSSFRLAADWQSHNLIPTDELNRVHFIAFQLFTAVVIWSAFAKWPTFAECWIRPAVALFSRIAARRAIAVVSIFVAALGLRLALLPVLGTPVPGVHDEFSYILSGDTFAHGRLTNPTPPYWKSFDTFHTVFVPTYASMYPPAQGFFLAIGELLGCAWIGVLLSVALFCAAVVWALQTWMPARWALLGGVIVTLNIGLVSYWINSYWGGAVSGLAGAIVLGAVPRILKWGRIRDSLLLGLGIFLLANSRPMEGLLYSLPFAVVFIARARGNPHSTVFMYRTLIPLVVCIVCTFAFTGYYNWRITGDPFIMPHLYRDRMYATAARFIWEKPKPEHRYANQQFQDYYSGSEANHYRRTAADFFRTLLEKLWAYSEVFLWVGSLPALLCIPVLGVNRSARILLGLGFWCVLGLCAVPWPAPHYAAPVSATFYAIIVYALRRLGLLKIGKHPIGKGLARACMVLLFLSVPAVIAERRLHPAEDEFYDVYAASWAGNVQRSRILANLQQLGGKHLIFVRYGADHVVHKEWVFNRADIVNSHVLWVRELDSCQNVDVAKAFRDRQLWLLEADFNPPQLVPYQLLQNACAGAASATDQF